MTARLPSDQRPRNGRRTRHALGASAERLATFASCSLLLCAGCASSVEPPAYVLEVGTPIAGLAGGGDSMPITLRVLESSPVRLNLCQPRVGFLEARVSRAWRIVSASTTTVLSSRFCADTTLAAGATHQLGFLAFASYAPGSRPAPGTPVRFTLEIGGADVASSEFRLPSR
jgi:hypothetical protein